MESTILTKFVIVTGPHSTALQFILAAMQTEPLLACLARIEID